MLTNVTRNTYLQLASPLNSEGPLWALNAGTFCPQRSFKFPVRLNQVCHTLLKRNKVLSPPESNSRTSEQKQDLHMEFADLKAQVSKKKYYFKS
jgi:hypothetical protein